MKKEDTKVVSGNANTSKKRCGCKSDYQDELYGKGIRVHNITGGSGRLAKSQGGWRCTVCGLTKT